MRDCPACGRAYAEILGAPEQKCPHCGHVVASAAASPAQAPALARAQRWADPVSAASLALRSFARGYGALSILWIPAFVVYLGVDLLVAKLGSVLPDDPRAIDPIQGMRVLGAVTPLFLASLLVSVATWGAIAWWLARRESGVATPRPSLARLLGAGAVLAPTFALSPLLLFAPLHWFLFVPAAVAEGQPLAAAFASSRAFARERQTYGFTALVILVWGATLILTVAILGPALGRGLAATGIPSAYAAATGEALAAWALGPLVPLFPAAYWVLAKRDGGTLAATGPETAAERWTTTKCPQCSALVPYAATGAPVHVVCPVCGREGDVI